MKIRQAVGSDIEQLLQIRLNPEVAKQQYPIKPDLAKTDFQSVIENRVESCRLDVIVCDESIAGYVRQTSGNIDDLKIYALGWNLAPEFWGNGVMTHSLTQLMNDLRNPTGRTLFVADCFQSNERCVSLLNRLEFAPWKIGIGEQFAGMLKNKCLKWVLRFCLQKENPNVSAE